jgi:hypothetical protein
VSKQHTREDLLQQIASNPFLQHLESPLEEEPKKTSFYMWYFKYSSKKRKQHLERARSEHRFFTLTRCVLSLDAQSENILVFSVNEIGVALDLQGIDESPQV